MVEEFVEQQVGPLGANLIRSQGGTDIASVQGDAGDQLLGHLGGLWGGAVDEQLPVLALLDLELVEVLLELLSELLHGGHIREENRLDNSLLDQLDLGPVELATEKVVLGDVEQLDSLCSVEVLLDVLLAVHLANGGLGDHVVPVVEAVVLDVVAQGGHN